ncbi:protein phosphatase [Paraburkholderia sp. EB58]|uniref:PP2C family protein-serine/threonine phosphatase n=1 Tax=Paraburkholderia sp. EB58 TaxID=3035125 RepID=UPI003D1E39AC
MTCASQFRWVSSARSDVGRVREHNEDACLQQPERACWAVADGMGGHSVGDLASGLIVDALSRPSAPDNLARCLADASERLLSVNQRLRDEAARRQVSVIGSTVVALFACDSYCGYLWAGDSRLYLCRQGHLQQLTRDHSQVEELKALGLLTEEEAINHPAQHLITRAVGATDQLELDSNTMAVADGDVFLLCSDGLSNELSAQEMQVALTVADCDVACNALIEAALARGGRDNITAVVIRAEDTYATDKTLLNPAP